MEQQIRFCTTSDGVRIAYTILGEGPAIVRVLGWFTHLEYEWKSQYFRPLLEVAASQYRQIRFDGRGMGLSDRDVSDFSLEGHVRDLEAVVGAAGIERFGLTGISQGGPTAITYAVRHPERVTHLVLYGSYARQKPAGLDLDTEQGRAQFDAMLTLMRYGWGSDSPAFRQMFTGLFMPEGDADSIREFNEMQRASTSGETAAALFAAEMKVDVRDLLPKVSVPTLVIHRKGDGIVPFELGRQLATAIPGARFLPLEGNNHAILPHEPEVLKIGVEVDNFTRKVLENEKKRRQAASVVSKERDLIGKVISHYKILEKVGEGGMGVVYKADDTSLHRPVALKFLPPDLTRDFETQERFLREARAAAALDHPSICTVHEIGTFEGQAFIAMAHIDGQGLDEKIASGPIDVNEVLNLGIQIAEGLQEAHEKGVIHRDIKAANIMLTKRGHARIMDFGLAKLTDKTRLTKTATIMGTVSYMSPEQAQGNPVDHRTDIWSLGVVLYEMLSGKKPFDAPTDTGVIYKIVHEEPDFIPDIGSDAPEALAEAVRKMMQKEPADRYESMEALISDLRAIRSGTVPKIGIREKAIPSIAVLPFVDMSPARDQEYFCDGISESLINELTQLRDLKVIARTSAFSFKGQNIDVREIGKRLGVASVLEGSIQKAGDRVRVTAQLVNTTHGEHLWSEKYDRKMEDIFAIQDEISEAIVDKLKPKLLQMEKTRIARHKSVDLEAYNLYLKGRYFMGRASMEGVEKAIECFEKAVEKDPSFALAYAGLADANIHKTFWDVFPPKEAYPKAKAAARKALEIDDTLSEAVTALAHMKTTFEWDWESAEKDYERAIELNPGYAAVHQHYAQHLVCLTRFDEAIREMKRALELDPLSLLINRNAGMIYLYAREPDKAIEQCQKTLELDPHFSGTRVFLGVAYLNKSMYEDALAELKKAKEQATFTPIGVETIISMTYALMGKRELAVQSLKRLMERSRHEYIPPAFLANLNFALGEKDRGFEWLEESYKQRDNWLCYIKASWFFEMMGLDSDPRYIALLKKMGLEP